MRQRHAYSLATALACVLASNAARAAEDASSDFGSAFDAFLSEETAASGDADLAEDAASSDDAALADDSASANDSSARDRGVGAAAIYVYSSAASSAANLSDLYNSLTTPPSGVDGAKPGPPADAQADTTPAALLLDVTINGTALPDVASAELSPSGILILPESAWDAARLKHPAEALRLSTGETGYALGSVPGLDYTLDISALKLTITAPAAAFLSGALDLGEDRPLPPRHSPPGGYINYDFSVTRSDDGAIYYGGLVDTVLFNGWGSLVNRMVVRGDNRGDSFDAVRTETYWQKDLPGRMETIVAGDTISSDGGWSRPVRFGGVRYGRDFSLAPSFITFPMPNISGSAALPSTIDVLVNNSKQRTGINVSPGAFDITKVPVTTGSGQINLVVTDLRGVQTLISRDYYSSAKLLAPGLSDFSFEAGSLRRDFGTRSNSYGPGFVAASWRQGLTSGLTLQGRFELQEERQAAGAEAVVKIGNFALARGSASYASGHLTPTVDPDSGWHYLLSLERVSRRGSLFAEWERFDRGFEQFGNYAYSIRPKQRLRVGGGLSPFSGLSMGASYIDQKTWDGDRYRIISGNAGISLPEGFHLSGYGARQLSKERGWSFGLNLSKSLGRQRSASASLNRSNDGRYAKYLSVSQSAPIGPGLGWRVEASDSSYQELRAGVTLNTNVAQFAADADLGQGNNAIRLGASGSLGWMKGLAFASREIDGHSFAVVKVGDLAGVKVYRANQYAAKTNSKGLALVTGLLPYQYNKLSLEPDELPFNVEIRGTEDNAVPYARAGVFVDFPVKRSLNALVSFKSPSGDALPIGSLVHASNGQEFVVGKRGEAYLTDLAASNTLDISWLGGSCQVVISMDPKATEEAVIGPVTCGGQ